MTDLYDVEVNNKIVFSTTDKRKAWNRFEFEQRYSLLNRRGHVLLIENGAIVGKVQYQ